MSRRNKTKLEEGIRPEMPLSNLIGHYFKTKMLPFTKFIYISFPKMLNFSLPPTLVLIPISQAYLEKILIVEFENGCQL